MRRSDCLQPDQPSCRKILISIDIFLQLGLNETIDVVDMDHSFDLCLIRRLNRKSKDTKTKNENLIWLTVIDNKQRRPLQCNGALFVIINTWKINLRNLLPVKTRLPGRSSWPK